MSERWFLGNVEQLDNFYRDAKENLPMTIELYRKLRNQDQNALLHAICRDVAKVKGDETADEIKRFIKLRFGVPLLRSEDPSFRALYDKAIKHSLTYEEKLEAMEILPVTRRMDTDQMSRLIDQVIQYYATQGYEINMPH